MKKNGLYLVCLFVLGICCSMSNCNKNDEPGPRTTVYGVVTNYSTGLPISGVGLKVTQYKEAQGIPMLYTTSSSSREYDAITTKSDGSYSYTFTPLGSGTFTLNQYSFPGYFGFSSTTPLTLGASNSFDFKLQKLIKLDLHLVNNTDHNTAYGTLYVKGCCYVVDFPYATISIGRKKLDTVIHTQMPQLSAINIQCIFSSANTSITVNQKFNSGLNDTTITVINL